MKVFVTTQDVATRRSEIVGEMTLEEFAAVQEVVQATGHKINLVPNRGGKLAPEQVRAVVLQHADEHMVAPRAVFIAQAAPWSPATSGPVTTDVLSFGTSASPFRFAQDDSRQHRH